MSQLYSLVLLFFCGLRRDKILWSLVLVSLLIVIAIPIFSLFSMRQVQELAVTLSLSGTSLFLLVCTVFLGATSIWRDLEKKFAVSVVALPLSRHLFVISKFFSLGTFLLLSLFVLCGLSAVGVVLATSLHPPERLLVWFNFGLAFGMLGLKYLMLLAITLVFSALSTSFFLPVFGSLSLFLAGSASHQVVEFILRSPEKFSSLLVKCIHVLHYLIPNFAAFDYQVYAIYGLPISWNEVGMSLIYGIVYTTVALMLATVLFNRREI